MSKPRDVARILGRTEAANPSNFALSLDGSTEPTTQYDSIGLLPVTGLTAGTQAFVTSTNRLYVSNGSGWYNTALINATPALSLSSSGTIALTPGSATTITMTATDSDNADANLVLSLESGGDLFKFAIVSQDSSVVTITPRTEDSASTLGSDGSATLTFKASDGINQATVQNTFTLAFGPDWTATPTETKLTASDAESGDRYGKSVSISSDGSYAIVGAYLEDTGTGTQLGAAYIYIRSGSSWTQQAKIQASDKTSGDNFGYSVSINSDGTYVAVGAKGDDGVSGDGDRGAVYVFTRSGTTWSQQAKVQHSDSVYNDRLGWSVSINSDATYIVSGAYTHTSSDYGAGYVFTRSGSTWTQQAKIQSSDVESGDQFGGHISISGDGAYVIAGARQEDTGGSNAGAAYIFSRSGTTWTQQQKIQLSSPSASDYFGCSVSMNSDGTYAIVGAYGEDTGFNDFGSAYIFTRSGTTWSQQAQLQSSDTPGFLYFGSSVSISSNSNFAIVCSDYEQTGGSNAGASYIFSRSGSTWTLDAKIVTSDIEAGDAIGFGGAGAAMSSDGSYVIVGAYGEDAGGSNAGAAYIFEAG